MVRPKLHTTGLLRDKADEPARIGEIVVSESKNGTFRSGIHPFDPGQLAKLLDGDDLQQVSTSGGKVPKRSANSAAKLSISTSFTRLAMRR